VAEERGGRREGKRRGAESTFTGAQWRIRCTKLMFTTTLTIGENVGTNTYTARHMHMHTYTHRGAMTDQHAESWRTGVHVHARAAITYQAMKKTTNWLWEKSQDGD
jgi:hypothetical protein